jgi:hypothetical protein
MVRFLCSLALCIAMANASEVSGYITSSPLSCHTDVTSLLRN